MHDNRRVHLTQRLEQLKVEYKRAEIQQYKEHFTKSIEHFFSKISVCG